MAYHIAVVGGIGCDLHAFAADTVQMYTSNIGRIQMSAGGVARSIAENLARLGAQVFLIGAVGDDVLSDTVLRDTRDAGVYTMYVRKREGMACSTYVSMLADGQMLTAVSDMRTAESLTADEVIHALQQIEDLRIVVADTNVHVNVLQALVCWGNNNKVPVFCEPVNTVKAQKICALHGEVFAVTPNVHEANAMLSMLYQESSTQDTHLCIHHWIITRDKCGAAYWQAETSSAYLYRISAEKVVNANGAGDAFMAGLVYNFMHTGSLQNAVYFAAAAGALTVQHMCSVHPNMSVQAVYNIRGNHEDTD